MHAPRPAEPGKGACVNISTVCRHSSPPCLTTVSAELHGYIYKSLQCQKLDSVSSLKVSQDIVGNGHGVGQVWLASDMVMYCTTTSDPNGSILLQKRPQVYSLWLWHKTESTSSEGTLTLLWFS